MKHLTLIFLLTTAATSCRFYYKEKPFAEKLIPFKVTDLSYQFVNEKVFIPKCLSCHGNAGGVNLESYEQVKNNIYQIELTAIVNKTMPKNAALSNAESEILKEWIAAGIPENRTPPVQPTEIPPPLEATFTSIKKNIFDKKCIACHSAGNEAEFFPLDSIDSMLNSPRPMVIAGNPDESSLVLAIESDGNSRMPPAETGDRLLPTEIFIIRQWITNNLPE